MSTMMTVSLLLNIAVLLPVCAGLITDRAPMRAVFGERTQARGILLSIYLAILAISIALLILGDARATAALLAVQVVYKVTTPLTVGTLKNPVVSSNLAIAAVHATTLASYGWPLSG